MRADVLVKRLSILFLKNLSFSRLPSNRVGHSFETPGLLLPFRRAGDFGPMSQTGP
jgi:hypothetical protein